MELGDPRPPSTDGASPARIDPEAGVELLSPLGELSPGSSFAQPGPDILPADSLEAPLAGEGQGAGATVAAQAPPSPAAATTPEQDARVDHASEVAGSGGAPSPAQLPAATGVVAQPDPPQEQDAPAAAEQPCFDDTAGPAMIWTTSAGVSGLRLSAALPALAQAPWQPH